MYSFIHISRFLPALVEISSKPWFLQVPLIKEIPYFWNVLFFEILETKSSDNKILLSYKYSWVEVLAIPALFPEPRKIVQNASKIARKERRGTKIRPICENKSPLKYRQKFVPLKYCSILPVWLQRGSIKSSDFCKIFFEFSEELIVASSLIHRCERMNTSEFGPCHSLWNIIIHFSATKSKLDSYVSDTFPPYVCTTPCMCHAL